VPMLWLWFCFAMGVMAMVLAVMHGKLKPQTAIWIIIAIGAVDVLRVDAQFIKVINPQPYFYTEPALAPLKSEMALAPFRVFALPGALPQNGEGVQNLEGVGGFHDNELRWYREFRGDQQDRNYFEKLLGFTPQGQPYLKAEEIDKGNAFLGIANAKYLLGRNGRDLMVIENKNALGRVSFVPNFTVLDSSRIISALQRDEYNYRTTVALQQRPAGLTLPPAMPDSQALLLPTLKTEWQRYTPNDRVVKVTAPQDGFLRISEVYYPGWKIFIDGHQIPVLRADLAWMAVPVTRGDHTLRMNANSLYFGKAIWITGLMALSLFLYWAGVLVAGRRRSVPEVKAA
jgi:hypothetical protein